MKKIQLPFRLNRAILACGADMKGAFAFAKGAYAYLFDGFGDLSDLDNFMSYERAVKAAENNFNIKPQLIVCDMHPGYFSTQFAKRYAQGARRMILHETQHHEAHIASAIIDSDIKGEVFGVAFDGTGYGLDGNIWGGEFFAGDLKGLKRVSHIDYIPMPGGEACIREPWRMAASLLYSIFGANFLKLKMDFVKNIDKKSWAVLKEMIDKKINSPLTSSVGRLFDATGSIVLNREKSKFEAELPMALERIAAKDIDDSYGSGSIAGIVKRMVRDAKKRVEASAISARFHNSIAEVILSAAKKAKIKRVALSGGVFQNRYLKDRAIKLLEENGFKAYTHSGVETNDSGIPIGQIAIASARVLACV